MPEQGYYGTENSPYANLYSERKVLTPQTSGGSLEEGEYRLRTDLNSGDRIATYEINVGGGVEEAPVFPISMSANSEIQKVRQVFIPGEGWGFVPLLESGARYSELKFYHDGTWYNWHDSLTTIPASEADGKLAHRWILNDVNGTVTDSVGNADGTVNGVTSVSGDWAGGSAGSGDGTDDYIETDVIGFGTNITGDWAIAFSFETTAGSGLFAGANDGPNEAVMITLGEFGAIDDNRLGLYVNDDTDSGPRVQSSVDVNDGDQYRAVCNKIGNDGSDFEIWINQVDRTSVQITDSLGTFDGIGEPWALFSNFLDGSDQDHIDAVIDDFCIFGDSLTQAEIESYGNPWD